MVDKRFSAEYDPEIEAELEKELRELQQSGEDFIRFVAEHTTRPKPGEIVSARVVKVTDDEVVVDADFKCEGRIPKNEFEPNEIPSVGDTIDVLLEGMDEDKGELLVSFRKAKRIKTWENLIKEKKEGDVVQGVVKRRTKGGLLVDIGGVQAFLPSSQVDIRRPGDLNEWIGREVECAILRIDSHRRNVVVSRRKLLEERREKAKKELLERIKVGDVVKGVVKNLTDFGAFIDLGGIDGLLHITDMSWGRIGHPSEMLKVDDEIEVKILNIDYENEKIALGLKQLTPSPWENIEEKYPIGKKVKGRVVSVTNYGAFVELEPGVEGLVHISEMSWQRRINHPSELVQPGDEIEVVVLRINPEKQEISLGMKQATPDPWDQVLEKYPEGAHVKGIVRNLVQYGAFIELEPGVEGLLHVNDMSWTRKINHPSEVLEKGQEIECVVLGVDRERRRISLGLKQLKPDPWESEIPTKYAPGSVVRGKVTKLTNFGAFVELEPELEGLLHISELSDKKIDDPGEIVQPGDEIEVKVIDVDVQERKIRLSLRQAYEEGEGPEIRPAGTTETAELKGGLGESGGQLIDVSQFSPETATAAEASAQTDAQPSAQETSAPEAGPAAAPAEESSVQPPSSEGTPEPQAQTPAPEEADSAAAEPSSSEAPATEGSSTQPPTADAPESPVAGTEPQSEPTAAAPSVVGEQPPADQTAPSEPQPQQEAGPAPPEAPEQTP